MDQNPSDPDQKVPRGPLLLGAGLALAGVVVGIASAMIAVNVTRPDPMAAFTMQGMPQLPQLPQLPYIPQEALVSHPMVEQLPQDAGMATPMGDSSSIGLRQSPPPQQRSARDPSPGEPAMRAVMAWVAEDGRAKVCADGETPIQGAAAGDRAAALRMFQETYRVDINGDGFVSADEASVATARVVEGLDDDRSDTVERGEFQRIYGLISAIVAGCDDKLWETMRADALTTFDEVLDADGDGLATRMEIFAAQAKSFASDDKDGGQRVPLDAFTPLLPDMSGGF